MPAEAPFVVRALRQAPVALALGVAVLAIVLPVGSMLWTSVRLEQVVLRSGVVHQPVGEVSERRGALAFAVQSGPGQARVNLEVPLSDVAERRTVFGLDHYRFVLGDPRTLPLLRTSLTLAGGAALLALLLGLPAAYALARVRLPARGLLTALAVSPLVLPPLVIGMGAARPYAHALGALTGLAGPDLPLATAMLVLGATLSPLVVLLVSRAWAQVPAGPVEAALLLSGPRAAFRVAVLPQLLPAALGAGFLALLFALADFAVPDLMTFLLPDGGTPLAVFAKDVQLQWKQEHNTGRAVATGAPLLVLCLVALVLAALLLRRGGLLAGARTGRVRPAERRGPAATAGAVLLVLLPFALGLALPLMGILSWAGSGGETVARGSSPSPVAPAAAPRARLGDLSGTLDRTPGSREQRDRWVRTGLAATLLGLATAVALARWAAGGGRGARLVVGSLAALSLSSPGLVLGVGTLLTWSHLGGLEEGIGRSVLALVGRFFPVALLGALLALRQVRRGYEEAAATLGAPPSARLLRIVLPLAGPGVLGAGLLVLVLALREVDAVVLLETRIFPLLIYDKIHYSRLADEANLVLLYLLWISLPVLAYLALRALGRWRRGDLRPS